jgi:hypothetical protein
MSITQSQYRRYIIVRMVTTLLAFGQDEFTDQGGDVVKAHRV